MDNNVLSIGYSTNQDLFVSWLCVNVFRRAVYDDINAFVSTCSDRGLWDLLLIDIQVQRSLTQLLQVTSGGRAETLQRQAHILLSNEQSLHHTFGGVQQICEGNLDGRTIERT